MQRLLTNSIQLNWLRTFAVAGKYLSFTLAAEELNMSQSAVSQQIQLLEHHLNQKLFYRANRSIRLTDAGRAFLPIVKNTINQLNQGATQIFAPLDEAVVEVNINTAFTELWLAPRLQQFSAIYPQITIRQHSTNWASDYPISTTELEIRYGRGDWAGFECIPLITQKLRPYCTPANAKQIREPADVNKLALLDVFGTPQGWNSWLEKTGLCDLPLRTIQFMDSHATAAAIAANGMGICLMYDDFMQEGFLAKQLVAPFFDSIETESGYFVCYKSEKNLSVASRLFKDWLLSYV